MAGPRSRLWWRKTLRIARIPAGDPIVPVVVVSGENLTAEDGTELTTEDGTNITTEAA